METALNALKDWVLTNSKKQDDRSPAISWIWWAVLAAGAAALIGYFYYKAYQQGKELSKLQHDKDVADEQAKAAIANGQIADNTKDITTSMLDYKEAKIKSIDIDLKINQLNDNISKTEIDINAIKNWNDVDSYINSKPGSKS